MNSREPEVTPPIDPERELPPESAADAAAATAGDAMRRVEEERDMLQDRLLRALADADNVRKRAQRELHEARLHAIAEAVRPFLGVLDGFERAALHAAAHSNEDTKALRKGFDLLHRQLLDAARKTGLEPVESLGQTFDPHLHEAVEMVETDSSPDGTVVEEFQRGYKLNNRLIRPAMVKVARSKS